MNLPQLRKLRGFTASELATQLGISQGHVSNIERGKRSVNSDMIKRIASVLNSTVEEVTDVLKNQPSPAPHKLNSWIGNLRINRMPLLAAFKNYIEYKDLNVATIDDANLSRELIRFVENNIGMSLQHELKSNKGLLMKIRNEIGFTPERIHTSHEGNLQ